MEMKEEKETKKVPLEETETKEEEKKENGKGRDNERIGEEELRVNLVKEVQMEERTRGREDQEYKDEARK